MLEPFDTVFVEFDLFDDDPELEDDELLEEELAFVLELVAEDVFEVLAEEEPEELLDAEPAAKALLTVEIKLPSSLGYCQVINPAFHRMPEFLACVMKLAKLDAVNRPVL